ncbi:copper resistance protein NlpE N-terminal domain-containing protein [Flavobacterium sp.]|uniref:copper resistance protein NlpE N-terminal domain-containing protein n=1 Tax=Flavobacterium sp. TaxID=239 RepID=UPI002FDE36C6
MKAKMLPVILLWCCFVGCQKQTERNTSAQDSIAKADSVAVNAHHAKSSLDYIGTYKGILPCADCEGMETIICINENETYNVKTRYLGKGEKVFEQKGRFSWNAKGNTIILQDIKSGPNQYFVGENTLTQLDMDGKKITGALASNYILTKQPSHKIADEVETNSQTTVDLNSRIESETVIKKVNPAVGKASLAETKWKLMTLGGKLVQQKGKKAYFIWLNSKDGRFNAFAGCNLMTGSYAMPTAAELVFSNVAMTRMACPDMTLETRFAAMLEKVDSYSIQDNILQFKKSKKTILATFEPSN